MDNSPEKLKKELEEELQLNSDDLRSHAWYHGRIPRQVRGLGAAKRALSFHRLKCCVHLCYLHCCSRDIIMLIHVEGMGVYHSLAQNEAAEEGFRADAGGNSGFFRI